MNFTATGQTGLPSPIRGGKRVPSTSCAEPGSRLFVGAAGGDQVTAQEQMTQAAAVHAIPGAPIVALRSGRGRRGPVGFKGIEAGFGGRGRNVG